MVFFREKIKRKKQTHRLEIELLDSTHHLTHSTTEDMKEWKEICSKDLTIDEYKAEYNFSMQGNCSALFAFLSHCLPLKPQDNAPLLLHASTFDFFDAKNFPIPQEIELLHAQENKTIAKRFLGLMALIASPFVATWFYLDSAFYPCSLHNAVIDRDTQKVEKLLKAGLDPNVQCYEKRHALIPIINIILNLPSGGAIETPLDRATSDISSSYTGIKTRDELDKLNEIIQLLIESGATIKKEQVSRSFENGSKTVIELFIKNVDFLGDEEQVESTFYALRNRPIRSEQDYREYEELLVWCLKLLPHNEKRQTMLDDAFFYTSNAKKAELFLKYGANINTLNSNGETRLMNKFRNTPLDDDLVIMLLEHGINVNIKNNHNNTALDIFNRLNQKGWYQEDKKEIRELLKAKGAKSGAEL